MNLAIVLYTQQNYWQILNSTSFCKMKIINHLSIAAGDDPRSRASDSPSVSLPGDVGRWVSFDSAGDVHLEVVVR